MDLSLAWLGLLFIGLVVILLVLAGVSVNKQAGLDDFEDAHIVITGGSSGIGLELAKKLGRMPEPKPKITLVARNTARLEAAVKAVRQGNGEPSVIGLSYDLSQLEKASQAVESAQRLHGPIQVLVNCAGSATPGYFEELEPQDIVEQMQANYLSTALMTHAVARSMTRVRSEQRRAIMTISSTGGLLGLFGYSAYAPTKAATAHLMSCLYFELRPHGINVSTFFAPDTDTPGFAAENRSKPVETTLTASSAKVHSPSDVASSILGCLQSGKHRGFHDVESWMVGILGSGTSPGATVLELLLMPVLRLVMQFIYAGWHRTIAVEFANRKKRA